MLLVLLVLLGPGRSGLRHRGRALAQPSDAGVETRPFGFGPLPTTAPAIDPRADARTLIGIAAEAGRTLAADPTSVQAAFTRAQALERLHLPHVARKAWEKVVDLAPGTDLGAEAREHLEVLQTEPSADEVWAQNRTELETALAADDAQRVRELVDDHRQRVRQWIQDELLPAWAAAAQGGDATLAARSLGFARRLAAVLEQLTSDHLTADSIAAIDGAAGVHRWQLAQGHALWAEAKKLHERQDYEHARPIFQKAEADLEAGASPFALWPRLYLAIEDYHAPDLPAALADLQTLENRYEPDRYLIFDGYVHWILHLVRQQSGPSPTALPDCELAAQRFRQSGEIENQVAMESSATALLVHAGDLGRAWKHLDRSFSERDSLGQSRHAENMLWVAVDALRAGGEPAAALPLANELLDDAEIRDNPLGISLALRKRGELLLDLGGDEQALTEHLDRAHQVAEEIPDPGLRRVIESEALIARARARCALDPAGGIDDLDRAEHFVLESGHRRLLLQVLSERAYCRQMVGDREGAERDLKRALAEVEAQRSLILDPELRISYADQVRSVLEQSVALALSGGDGKGALATAERLRAPELLASLYSIGSAAPPSDPIAISRSLPPGTAIVELLSLPGELVAWILKDGEMSLVRTPLSRRDLEKDVQELRRAIAHAEAPPASAMETRLVRALLPGIGMARTVVVVPDGPLFDLPFGALRDPPSGRYLAERFGFATAASARAYIALEKRARRLGGGRPRSVLAVGGVPYSRLLFPELGRLPASGTEARVVASAYPAGEWLTGSAATPKRLLEDAPSFDVIHLATHAIDFPEDPSMASLLLAPGPGGAGDGVLPARDLDFPRPLSARVVALAACRTAEGRISPSEGPLNLARPFLSAGAPSVVASLWALDDAVSLAFFTRFHEELAKGAAPVEAFHTAQLYLLQSPNQRLNAPRSWAGLVLVGATDGAAGR